MTEPRPMERSGIFSLEELEAAGHVPPEARIARGGVVMAECIQNIPCDPCRVSCPVKAISMEGINDNPCVDFEACIGCRSCIYRCPGLAIFYMDASGDRGVLGLPCEMRPLPAIGAGVEMLDRAGEPLGPGKVLRVELTPNHDRTAVVILETDRELLLKARHFREREGQ